MTSNTTKCDNLVVLQAIVSEPLIWEATIVGMISFRLNPEQMKKAFITMFCSNRFIKCKISHEKSIHMIRKMVYKDGWPIYPLMSEFATLLRNESRLCWDELICQSSGSRRHIWLLANWMAIFRLSSPRMLASSANKHETQTGQRPRNCASCFGISPSSAMTINRGKGVWCKRQWWLIISSWRGDSACGRTICSKFGGSK